MDGVILDTEAIATEGLLKRFPNTIVDFHKEILTGNYHEEIQKYIQANNIVEDPEERKAHSLTYSKLKLESSMFPGIYEFLKKIHDLGYVLVLNTSAAERNSVPMLEKAGVLELFDFIGHKEVAISKVHKFALIKERYPEPDNKFLFVTDTLGDLREADVAGVPTICVTWGAHDHSYFNREPHSNLLTIVDSVDQLSTFIQQY